MTNRDIASYVAERKPFKLPSSSARYTENGQYVVYSYTTAMAIFTNGKRTYFNEEKYSQTTTKLQNMIRGVK